MRAGFTCDSTADWITGSQLGGAWPSIALCPAVIGSARSARTCERWGSLTGRTGFGTLGIISKGIFFFLSSYDDVSKTKKRRKFSRFLGKRQTRETVEIKAFFFGNEFS